MHLLINTVLPDAVFTMLDKNHAVITTEIFTIAGAEYDLFLSTLEKFAAKNICKIQDLKTIYAVTGPASFTGGRIVTLTLGTLSLVYGIPLVGITLYEYWELTGNAYPMAFGINPTEYILKPSSSSEMQLMSANDISGLVPSTFHLPRFQLPTGQTGIQLKQSWDTLKLSSLAARTRTTTIDPLYCKKPNITLSR